MREGGEGGREGREGRVGEGVRHLVSCLIGQSTVGGK